MHQSSYVKMEAFREKYLTPYENERLAILDLGSQDVNGSYRAIFDSPFWEYRGADMIAGDNVNIILSDIYNWEELESDSVDVFISGQTFEHIEYIWLTMKEIQRILKPGGLCCIIAPSGGFEHKYPVDCWRIYPDGFSALANYAGLETLEVYAQWESLNYPDGSDVWQDCILVAKKTGSDIIKRFDGLNAAYNKEQTLLKDIVLRKVREQAAGQKNEIGHQPQKKQHVSFYKRLKLFFT